MHMLPRASSRSRGMRVGDIVCARASRAPTWRPVFRNAASLGCGLRDTRLSKRMGSHGTTARDVRIVMDCLRHVVRTLRVSARAAEKRVGVSGAQLFVLQKLAEADALSVGELALRTATDQSSVSVVVRRLAGRKLVGCRPGKSDGRRVEVRLTDRGKRLLRRAPPATQVDLIAALSRLPRPTRRALAESLQALAAQIGSQAPPPMFFEDEASGKL